MAIVKELLSAGTDGTISFGNHKLANKAKKEDFEYAGSVWKVKTHKTMTRLEKNEMFVYESVPGTSVNEFKESADGLSFIVEGDEDAQITVDLEEGAAYEVFIGTETAGEMKTNLSGKLSFSVELAGEGEVPIKIIKK
jgi:hypothetical protein